MTEKSLPTNTLTLDGVQHDVSKFSPTVQHAISIYNRFTSELQEQQLAVLKTQAAIAHFSTQIAAAVKSELNPEPDEKTSEVAE